MRLRFVVVGVGFFALCAGCGKRSDQREYALQGQVLAIDASHQQATISHEEIKGFMAAMTMPYKVREERLLDGIVPGDVIHAKLVVLPDDAFLIELRKVGQAPLPKPPSEAAQTASAGFELLKPGEEVPEAAFIDQNGKKRTFRSFNGAITLVTFIYTSCPFPNFCPLMDRHFAAIQGALKNNAAMNGRVHLVSISFDPLTDTPPVLKAHARKLAADLKTWTFLTGDRDGIDRFAARFGVSVARGETDQRDITHTLRTAIVNPEGKLVKVYIGNEWTPEQVLADLDSLVHAH